MDIKLKSGIEIHQQIDTHKLFCACPSILRQDNPDLIVKRKIKAVAGESGSIDQAALHEQLKELDFIYEAYKDNNCLVELDEEPPHKINREALITALQLALILNTKIFPVVQVMRKTIINGSCVSGFQRTMLLAQDGFFEIEIQGKKKQIGIQSICLEEDAAREIKKDKNSVTFRLDRLGIPLIELVTKPDISSPEEAKAVALKLGEILRAFKVKRGIGTIRQDINVSTPGHPRVEIKGVQEPDLFAKVVDYEAKRQQQEKGKPEVRRANPDGSTTFLRPLPGSARMYPETDIPLVYTSEYVREARKSLPKLQEQIKLELKEKGMNPEFIKLILQENKLSEFEALHKLGNNPNLIAKILILWPKEISSHEKIPQDKIDERLSLDILEIIYEKFLKKEIQEQHIKQIMIEIVNGKDIQDAMKIEHKNSNELASYIAELIKSKPGLNINAYMGIVLKNHKGSNPRDIADILKKHVKG